MRLTLGLAASRGIVQARGATQLGIIKADAISAPGPSLSLAPAFSPGLTSPLGLSLDCQPCCNDCAAWPSCSCSRTFCLRTFSLRLGLEMEGDNVREVNAL